MHLVTDGGEDSRQSGLLETDWNDEYPFVLVLGTSRSGTSLVTAILDAHSRLTMSSELFRSEILLGQSSDWSVRQRSDRLQGFLAALQSTARANDGQRWGNKITTEVIFYGAGAVTLPRPDAIADLLRRLPRTPLVYVLRDGRAVVRSKMRRAGDTLEKSCRHWVLSVEIWEALRDAGWPMATVRFEDLVCDPAGTTRSLCSALGLRFEARMLDATSSRLLLPEYQRASFDPTAAATSNLEPEGMMLIAEAMARIGYTPATTDPGLDSCSTSVHSAVEVC